MFEPHDKGVVAHGDVEEVDVSSAERCLEELGLSPFDVPAQKWFSKEEWNAQWESTYPEVVDDVDGTPVPFHSGTDWP